ncbi:hypothetical protein TSAR_010154 [Trichomalopsis sarcophagae]|uniref:RNA helicase n=1 Tax=Trichomalopsis sarcophagae TaxID=543379 RepID=A0A232FMB8_9HYME|nr:hypothetical protein TSAR_010154 [Trichomalopsis sarcophagae]
MAESQRKQCFTSVIPQDAVEIRVTNIINPYFIRIKELPEDGKDKTKLFKKLFEVKSSQIKEKSHEHYTPSVGDDVLISSERLTNMDIDLPDWICRGVITDTTKRTSDVFLLDHGIAINVPTESLIKYSRNAVDIEPLTMTIGLYNILPIDPTAWKIVEQWPDSTVNFIKDLIQTSVKIYFAVLACDRKKNKKYGDIYLVIEDKNVSLIEILTLCSLAVPLYPELLSAIKSNNTTEEMLVPYQIEKLKTDTSKESTVNTAAYNNEHPRILIKNYVNKDKLMNNKKILIKTKRPCRPVEHLEDAQFTTAIHKALKDQGVRALKQIQSYMWPAIKQGFDTVAIGPHEAGKSVGYIVPIANNIAVDKELIIEKQKKEIVTKPIALFLCATVKKCIDVADMCDKVLNHEKVKYSAMYNGLSDKIVMANICNKFHILVTTPPFLLRTIEKYSNKLDLSEVSHLVIDQADALLDKYFTELITLIRKYKIINKEKKNGFQNGSVQIIAAAHNWTHKIKLFVEKFMEDPYICIGSFVEAAAFSRVKGRMLIRHSEKKKEEVLNILDDYSVIKTMIVCLNKEEALKLDDFLVSKSVQTLLVHEEMLITKVNELKEVWHKYLSGMYPVIICTDQVLLDLEITNIELLIHYSVTNTSKTLFGRRFSVLMDNWLMESQTDCRVIILFDESKGNKHFKGVVEILKRLNVTLPKDWKQIAEGLDLAYNMTIKNHPLCDSIKSFGTCERNSCPYRHCIISEVDTPTLNVTIGDELKLEITHVHHASHFSARIYEFIRKNEITGKNENFSYPFEAFKLDIAMKKHYKEPQNRRGVKDICIGGFYTYRKPEKDYARVQVQSIVEKDIKTDKPKKVRVQSLDDGQIFPQVYYYDFLAKVSELFELPQELLKYKCTVVDIFLTGIAPFDHEYEWTNLATEVTKQWKNKNCNNERDEYAYVKVLLHIGNCIWTDSVVCRSKIINHKDLVSSTLNDDLIKKELATSNDDHLSTLLTMCYNGGITEINGRPIAIPKKEKAETGSIDECD